MEVKTLLRLVKDDISHLEAITGEFSRNSLPSPDEIDVALVRANVLLRDLELLHKFAAQHESSYKTVKQEEEPHVKVQENLQPEHKPFKLFIQEDTDDEKSKILNPEQHDMTPAEVVQDAGMVIDSQQQFEEYPEVAPGASTDITPTTFETSGSGDKAILEAFVTKDERVYIDQEVPDPDETEGVEMVNVPNITDHEEEIVAEEFKEVKKTLNEVLGVSQHVVNDFLTQEKSEGGYQIIPIDSLWDGVGINDRFLYVRELFSNSSARFESTVEAIDKLGTIQEAVNYLKMNFKWNKTEASQKFLVLVKRRFTK